MEENKDRGTFDLPVNEDIIFSTHKNKYKKGVAKRQTKLLDKIKFIKPFLNQGEEILLVTTGCSPMSILEQFLMGWIIYYVKRSVFVFTSTRMFHIPTKANYTYRNSIAKINYSDCKSINLKNRTLVVEYGNGEKEKFYYIAGKERKKIKALLTDMPFGEYSSAAKKRAHLCPQCTAELEDKIFTCPGCRLEFKNKATAKMISWVYPGGGYFYTRHPFLGIGDAITETVLLVLAVVSLIDGVHTGDYTSFVFFCIFLIVEKAITVYDSNKFLAEYIPVETDITSSRSR